MSVNGKSLVNSHKALLHHPPEISTKKSNLFKKATMANWKLVKSEGRGVRLEAPYHRAWPPATRGEPIERPPDSPPSSEQASEEGVMEGV